MGVIFSPLIRLSLKAVFGPKKFVNFYKGSGFLSGSGSGSGPREFEKSDQDPDKNRPDPPHWFAVYRF
jgi:hypothetical protein